MSKSSASPSIELETAGCDVLDEACARDRCVRSSRGRVLVRWVAFGYRVEMAGVYLSALGLAVLAADLGVGGCQMLQLVLANATHQRWHAESMSYLALGQVTGLLWLGGFPLWAIGSALRRSSTFWLHCHTSSGEPAEPLGSRFAPPCPLFTVRAQR